MASRYKQRITPNPPCNVPDYIVILLNNRYADNGFKACQVIAGYV